MGQEQIDELNADRLKEIADSPAYPVNIPGEYYNGMTLREYIATQAMASLLTRNTGMRQEEIANFSVNQADALIKALHSK